MYLFVSSLSERLCILILTITNCWSWDLICAGQDGGKRMGLKFDRVKYWLSVGAQPSEPVQRLLFRTGLLPPPPMLAMGRKGGPRDTRPIDPMTGRYLTPNKPANDDQPKVSEGDEDSG
ncbi:hypothetical protein Vadar_028891 [Vaccinium darrowii]|uniref:Uncharacterized protein n=1 Tax=Vaccinium darrowii TaxID=229202 RepID=A0ACB7Z8D8_9ERIC|nr:hypothetical protein Vadar_028891 [Vaccinium darrowii]